MGEGKMEKNFFVVRVPEQQLTSASGAGRARPLMCTLSSPGSSSSSSSSSSDGETEAR